MNGFPWDKLQALPSDYGQTADIPTITQFRATKDSLLPNSKTTLTWQANSVNLCAIPGLADNLPASGSIETPLLTVSTLYVLRCGGPLGIASSQVNVSVTRPGTNDPKPLLEPAIVVQAPYTGYANILPDLMSLEAAEQVYKVVYYESETYLFQTAKPPFPLDTKRMENGKHTINARLYYRNGQTEEKSASITVNNSPETLFATIQSGNIIAPKSIPIVWGLSGLIIVMTVMTIGGRWGWHKAHLS